MNAMMPKGNVPDITASQLTLIKQTYARDCNDPEFNLFIEICRQTQLNPIKKQIYCIVYNKDKSEKRQMTIITAIDGYRAIANRSGHYRPAGDDDMVWITDDAKVSSINPQGIIEARYTARKWHPMSNSWMECIGKVFWEEYAPVEEEWAYSDEKGKRVPTGKKKLTDKWAGMPRNQIMKCAEAAALRRGWPEDLSGIYVEEEMDRANVIDLTATEVLEKDKIERREAAVRGANSYALVFDEEGGIQFIEAGKVHDMACHWIGTMKTLEALDRWCGTNANSLREFWARHKADALDLKEQIEKRRKFLTIWTQDNALQHIDKEDDLQELLVWWNCLPNQIADISAVYDAFAAKRERLSVRVA